MKRACFATAWLFLLAGCDRTATYTAAFKEQLQAQQELIEVLATVKDAESMKAAKPALNKRFADFERIRKKFQALPKPSEEIKTKLQDELGDEVRQTLNNLVREAKRIEELPGGKEFIARLKLQR